MIENYICERCIHYTICNVKSKFKPFMEDCKGYVGVQIEIKHCVNFKDSDEVE